jgi:serine protease Do
MSAAHAFVLAARPPANGAIAVELEALANQLRQITVRIHTRSDRFDGFGAGVLWAQRGESLVVTNAHVIPPRRGDRAQVELESGLAIDGRVIARDRELDLALMALDALPNGHAATAALGDDRRVHTGEIVAALGHPFGIPGALSVGVVHTEPADDHRWLLADIRLAPGNSGGPLATLDGRVIGINAMIVRGLGVAVPARTVRTFAAQVLGTPSSAS